MTTRPRRTRAFYAAAVRRYFRCMDKGDLAGTLACFAPRGWLICESVGIRLRGHRAIGKFFQAMTDNTRGMIHRPTNIVIDDKNGTVAAELVYKNDRRIGAKLDMENCNFFDVGADGRFTRVRFWTGRVVEQSKAMDVARSEMRRTVKRR